MATAAVTTAPLTSILVPPTPKQKAPVLMEVVIARDVLLADIAATHGITSFRTTVPILSNLRIEAHDGSLTISASNLEQTLCTRVMATVKKAGRATVPARKFYDYIRLLPGDISIRQLENSWIQINAGRSRTKMVGMPCDNFPAIPVPDSLKPVALSAPVLRAMIGHTIIAVSKEESRYVLNGALLVLEPDKLSMVSTDGHRLAVVEKDETSAGVDAARTLLIPAKALHDLASLLGATQDEQVMLFENETTIFFKMGLREYTTRKLTGTFPNYKAVIPANNPHHLIVRTSDLEKSVRRVAQFADEKSSGVKLNAGANALKISSSSVESGESEDIIDTPFAADPIAIKINAAYILDFCKAIGGVGEVKMSLKDGTSAGVLEPEDPAREFRYKYVVMPMRG